MTEFIQNPQIDEIENEVLRDFFRIWLTLREGPGTPRFEVFSLTLFEEHLPFIVMMDYHREADRFMIRFSGSHYVDGFGADNTGRFIDELPNTDALIGRFQRLVQTRKPYLVTRTLLTWSPKDYRFFDAIGCPIFDDNENVVSLLFRVEFLP